MRRVRALVLSVLIRARRSAYRSDIDGLRAVAVLAVVLFHFGYRGFAGGFVGVDIFFVISGYLITNIILNEVQHDTFSIARFYERRVRRLFPALLMTIVLVLGVAGVLFIPGNFKSLGQSVAAVALFVSNMFFWREGTYYFDQPAAHKPLLHTWSLSVEEQFYIVYPWFLLAVWKAFRERITAVLALLAVVSFAVSSYLTIFRPGAAFYWAPSRSWELLLGAVVAMLPRRGESRVSDLLALLGFGLILVSALSFDATTPFPGFHALLPTAGAALILLTGPATQISRLLSANLLVKIGLMSYSLYLLHWPLLVFARYVAVIDLTAAQTGALLAVTFALSAASWRFVEQPFRSRQRFSRRQIFALGGTGMTAVAAAALVVVSAEGFPGRLGTARDPDWYACDLRVPEDGDGLCTLGSAKARTASFLVWGDSHAGAFTPAIDQSAARHSKQGLLAYGSGCPAILMQGSPNPALQFGPNSPTCRQFNDTILAFIGSHPELETIVLAARWVRYGEEGGDVAEFEPALRRMVSSIASLGRRVVIVDQVPELDYELPEAYRMATLTGRDVSEMIAPRRDEYASRNSHVLSAFERLRQEGLAHVIDMRERMCDRPRCRIIESGQLLYSDDNHLSEYGSRYVSPLFDPILAVPGLDTRGRD